jgi:replication factor C large subunit
MEDWTEKYRPTSLIDIVGNKQAVLEIKSWADEWINGTPKKRALILSGASGIGKTSCAHALAKDYGWTVIELNTSDARNATKIKNVATFGATNETFNDKGQFISSRDNGRKLIILDEADNLYERIKFDKISNIDLSDKGGKKAIVDTIKITSQPIILIVNDYYNLIKGSGESLKNKCKLIKFYSPYTNLIFDMLKKICISENINISSEVLHILSEKCNGDIRSAIKDLQSICLDKKYVDIHSLDVIGYRDRNKVIFDTLRDIFKTQDIKNIKDSLMHLHEEPNNILLWINENLPIEYIDVDDFVKGYEALSKADIFLGRVYKRRNYRLWAYASDIMSGGVATSKTHIYSNKKYNFPLWLRKLKDSKSKRDIRDSIVKKISNKCHNSKSKSMDFLFFYFIHMFRNNIKFAIKMKELLNLTELEIIYILGKKYIDRKSEILSPYQSIEIKNNESKDKYDEKQKIENKIRQQSILDF